MELINYYWQTSNSRLVTLLAALVATLNYSAPPSCAEEAVTIRGGAKPTAVFDKLPSIVRGVSFSPDGTVIGIAIGTAEGKGIVCLYNIATGQEVQKVEDFQGDVYSVSFSPDGTIFATGSRDGHVGIRETASGKVLQKLPVRSGRVSVQFSPVGHLLAAGDAQGISLWETEKWEKLASLKGHDGSVESIAISNDGKTIASGGVDHTIRLWDAGRHDQRAVLGPLTAAVTSVAFSTENDSLFAGGLSGSEATFWNIASRRIDFRFKTETDFAWRVAVSRSGCLAVSDQKAIVLFDIKSRKRIAVLDGHKSIIDALAFSPDGKTLASGSWDKTVRLWRISD